MALLWVDGFEKWGTGNAVSPAATVASKYKLAGPAGMDIVAGRYNGYALMMDDTSAYIQTPHIHSGSPDRTLICGLAYKAVSLYAGQFVMTFVHPSEDGELNTSQFTLRLSANTPNSGLYITRGNTTLTTNNDALLTSNTWAYIEMKVYCHPTAGTCNVYVDGTEVISYTGNTQHRSYNESTTYSAVYLSARTTYGKEHHFDDLYIADGSGNTVNDVLGPCHVECLSPTSDASGNWTPNTGNNMYDNVNSQEADSDFIYTSASGNQAVFELDNLSANVAGGTVKGIMLNAESEQIGNSIMYAKTLTQNGSGNTVQHTGNFMPGTDGVSLSHTVIMEDDPDGNAWSLSTVNQLRAGVEAS